MHPSEFLFDSTLAPTLIPVCDHYAGNEKLMRKSLALQQELGAVFDITLDCEDGASAGAETEHATLVGQLISRTDNQFNRVGVRIHDCSHPAWKTDLSLILTQAADRIAYVTLPKVNSLAETVRMIDYCNEIVSKTGLARLIPIHVLIETHGALREAAQIAAHPQVACLSFGIMDFVSAHNGAIPAQAMVSPMQFSHPLILRAKTEIAAACHAHGKVASHNVCTDIQNLEVIHQDATRARQELAYTRMWSIHPVQIRPIINAFSPSHAEIADAEAILLAAQANAWGPIQYAGRLHDRASYRYYWLILQRAHQLGIALSANGHQAFFTHHDNATGSM